MDNAISYTKELVRRASPSYQSNAEVSDYVQETLKRNGFHTERVEYRDAHGVLKVNVLGKKGPGSGGISFFGHTDTVPAEGWKFDDPFKPFEKDGKLYGRGACDMKGPVACALAAAEGFEASDLAKPIYIVCTADEEVGYAGATVVADKSELFQEVLQSAGIICEHGQGSPQQHQRGNQREPENDSLPLGNEEDPRRAPGRGQLEPRIRPAHGGLEHRHQRQQRRVEHHLAQERCHGLLPAHARPGR
jgi:acetylornithine deacetylase/succinyl-diaminopimelate desuccinylase-like protein